MKRIKVDGNIIEKMSLSKGQIFVTQKGHFANFQALADSSILSCKFKKQYD